MDNKRALAAKFFPKPVATFDMINHSARFAHELTHVLGGSPPFKTRMPLHDHVGALCVDAPVDYYEFGVWKGESFRKWLTLNNHAGSRFAGFDSFEGLPEDWVAGQPKGTFSTGGNIPQINDPRGEFVVGWFQDTLYQFLDAKPPTNRIVAHVDCDLYSSSLFVLAALDRFLRPGSILIFDDFSSLAHEFNAWCDYRRSFNREWKALGYVEGGLQAAFIMVE